VPSKLPVGDTTATYNHSCYRLRPRFLNSDVGFNLPVLLFVDALVGTYGGGNFRFECDNKVCERPNVVGLL
jgi:hypothetical protein